MVFEPFFVILVFLSKFTLFCHFQPILTIIGSFSLKLLFSSFIAFFTQNDPKVPKIVKNSQNAQNCLKTPESLKNLI